MENEDKEKLSKASRYVLLIGFICYCMMGAKIFQALETDIQEELKLAFLDAETNLMETYVNITSEELEIFLQILSLSIKHGIIPVRNGAIYFSWDFRNSFSFVTSTLSTIGYGLIAPRTPMGQMFCVFYSLLGIPLTIIFLQSVSNALLQPLSEFEKYLQNMEMKETQIRTCELLFFLVTGLSIFILLPPLLFMKMEGWTYNEGLYFAFISLSTIGFGDYIIGVNPSKNYSNIYMAIVTLWCTFGIAWMALFFDLLSKNLEKTKISVTCNTLWQRERKFSGKRSHFWPSLRR
ncbi:potassium channel subfamily K member 16-like isoform X1 [Bos taurus]|uniref:potassium channel subfamily K member 16-like isoform X1 n=1 Tax=Bos taurus TaxID=9913 RepID=UPI0000EBCFBF|nr:potassium channel subfamily K member 16-like isoform X1 [Bos taurus]